MADSRKSGRPRWARSSFSSSSWRPSAARATTSATSFPAAGRRQAGEPRRLRSEGKVEAPDTKGITTVNEYTYVPGEKLPPVKGVSSYKWDADEKVVELPDQRLDRLAPDRGRQPRLRAQHRDLFFKKYGFKVNLKLIDDPVVARDAFAAGESHMLWGTLDMMALFAPELMQDSRTAPRIFQQIDWSNGGDGIVVRGTHPLGPGPQGQDVVYAQNTPPSTSSTTCCCTPASSPGR